MHAEGKSYAIFQKKIFSMTSLFSLVAFRAVHCHSEWSSMHGSGHGPGDFHVIRQDLVLEVRDNYIDFRREK